jgi:acyl transferase domain-containing protein
VLHRNTSDLGAIRFSTTLTGEEFFLVDHLVRMDGRTFEKVLPGVVCLEMARAAVVKAVTERPEGAVLELQNIVWAQPIIVTDPKELDITISANGEHYEFRISSGNVVHCQGRALWSGQTQAVTRDIAQLARQMEYEVAGESVYSAFVRTGGVYGPTFQGITRIDQGRGQLLAHLRLPEAILQSATDYVLHPSMMDSALRIPAWSTTGRPRAKRGAVRTELRVFAPCTAEMVA